ncbi:DUF899 domain-containing protein [Actinoalloteichus hymeniacidonis]|uniref:DUF899 domain-containing protein n=1 Tax=Actinoalloteichus hymeniacidonis TaxID=340345 RepID=A0AAC9HSG2_9PSEU|nr:DUF899 domain-containing protein [Actinoalloteichus hymeniacidonis]AOS64525.1 hypothetical protein TL08_18650 [Actinoalloteichus hymeniacidonis]MBB5907403.1 putative dithiol-disulfide oxidoreductase (DUF899 family) [Actinoalloteichus hymeniacidonis]
MNRVVSAHQWQVELDALRVDEKAHTKASDALAARRRRLPMVEVDKEYAFAGPAGPVSLLDLFDGRRQLITYCFMWHGAEDHCAGCSMFADNIGHLAHLHARDVSLALVSRGPLGEIRPFQRRMGWTIPWVSSLGTDFNADMGAGGGFALNVFLREGDTVYRTYCTTGRGVEALGSSWTFLDLTPFGRQENWEDSPSGHPQSEPYQWWRLHDEYDGA